MLHTQRCAEALLMGFMLCSLPKLSQSNALGSPFQFEPRSVAMGKMVLLPQDMLTSGPVPAGLPLLALLGGGTRPIRPASLAVE